MNTVLPIIVGLGGILVGLAIALIYIQPLLSRKMVSKMIPKEDYSSLSNKYAETKVTIEQLKSAVRTHKLKAEGFQKQVAELETQLAQMQPDFDKMKQQTTQIQVLTKEIEAVKIKYVRAEKQDTTLLDTKQKALDEALKQIEKQTARIAELQNQLTHQTAKLDRIQNPPVVPEIKPKKHTTDQEDAEKSDDAEAQKAHSEASKPKPATPKPALSEVISNLNDEDNLLIIKGIGEVIQDKLNQEGIRSFRDLSELNEEQIKDLQEKTRIFPSKLRKWSEEAKKIVQKRTEDA